MLLSCSLYANMYHVCFLCQFFFLQFLQVRVAHCIEVSARDSWEVFYQFLYLVLLFLLVAVLRVAVYCYFSQSAAAFFLNDSCSQPLILFGTLSLLLVFFWSHTSAFFGPLNNAKLLGETLTCMLWHVRLATVLATGPHVTLCARHARVLHMYIEKEYMKVMRETVSGGGSRYFAGSRYFMTPGPKLVHAVQHQIFKEKRKKSPARTNSRQWLPGNLEFFWSRLISEMVQAPFKYINVH